MDLVEALVQALDQGDTRRSEYLFECLHERILRSERKPIVAPFRYWIIVAKMPKAAKILVLGGEEEEKRVSASALERAKAEWKSRALREARLMEEMMESQGIALDIPA